MKFRFNMFETNSSSTHEIVLTEENNTNKTLQELLKKADRKKNNNIDFYKKFILEEEYDWDNFVLTSEPKKLDYVISQILNTNWFPTLNNDDDDTEQYSKSQKFIWGLFKNALLEKLGYNIMIPIDFAKDVREIHHIDHQSIISDKISIKNSKDIITILNNLWDIVFNPKIIIVGGNDNSEDQRKLDIIMDHKGKIIKNPFTRTKGIKNIFGKYENSIDDFKKSLQKETAK